MEALSVDNNKAAPRVSGLTTTNLCQQDDSSSTNLAASHSVGVLDSYEFKQSIGIPDSVQTLKSFWKVEEGQSQVVDVQGRLRQSLEFWENTLQPAPWIISYIRDDYKLPLRAIPDKYRRPNQSSALKHKDFVSVAIQELEQNRCIIKVQIFVAHCQ